MVVRLLLTSLSLHTELDSTQSYYHYSIFKKNNKIAYPGENELKIIDH